jgi:hypothetical protein
MKVFWEGLGIALVILSIGCCAHMGTGKPLVIVQHTQDKP